MKFWHRHLFAMLLVLGSFHAPVAGVTVPKTLHHAIEKLPADAQKLLHEVSGILTWVQTALVVTDSVFTMQTLKFINTQTIKQLLPTTVADEAEGLKTLVGFLRQQKKMPQQVLSDAVKNDAAVLGFNYDVLMELSRAANQRRSYLQKLVTEFGKLQQELTQLLNNVNSSTAPSEPGRLVAERKGMLQDFLRAENKFCKFMTGWRKLEIERIKYALEQKTFPAKLSGVPQWFEKEKHLVDFNLEVPLGQRFDSADFGLVDKAVKEVWRTQAVRALDTFDEFAGWAHRVRVDPQSRAQLEAEMKLKVADIEGYARRQSNVKPVRHVLNWHDTEVKVANNEPWLMKIDHPLLHPRTTQLKTQPTNTLVKPSKRKTKKSRSTKRAGKLKNFRGPQQKMKTKKPKDPVNVLQTLS